MFGCCNKKMQARTKESPDFESKIQNNPIELLKIIKMKMHDQSKDKMQACDINISTQNIVKMPTGR